MFQGIYRGESGGSPAGSNPSRRVVTYEIGTKRGSRHLPIRPSITLVAGGFRRLPVWCIGRNRANVKTENSASAPGLGTVQNRGSQFPACCEFAGILRPCDRRIHRLVLLGITTGFSRTVVLRYRFFLEQNNLAPSTINVRLAAVRRLAYEAAVHTVEPGTGCGHSPREGCLPWIPWILWILWIPWIPPDTLDTLDTPDTPDIPKALDTY